MTAFRLLIGVPSGASWNAQFGVDLVNLISAFTSKRVADYSSQSVRVANVRSSILPNNRLNIIKAGIASSSTHVLFIDSDQTFPADLPHRLAVHHKMVVAANCVTKQIPASPTARAKSADPRGVPVYTDPASKGLEQIWRIGTGVMLVNLAVFQKIGLGVWHMQYLPEEETYQGEDWTFCAACEAAGIPLYIDHDVSKLVGHVGSYEFTHDVVGQLRGEEDVAE
jgi:hypothetical protein